MIKHINWKKHTLKPILEWGIEEDDIVIRASNRNKALNKLKQYRRKELEKELSLLKVKDVIPLCNDFNCCFNRNVKNPGDICFECKDNQKEFYEKCKNGNCDCDEV